MKRNISLILALLLLLAIFAGCSGKPAEGGETPAPATAAPAATEKPAATQKPAATEAPAATEEPEPADEGPYKFAKGKYEVDERGVPLEKYTYEVPLTTSDEVFTYWTGMLLPDAIDADGYEGMPYPTYLRETTGVHIEYDLVANSSRSQNCAVLVASDALPDLLSNINYYFPGTMRSAIDDGYVANLFEYKDYFPNYYYCIYDHEDDLSVRAQLMADDTTIFYFKCLNDILKTAWACAVRGDWLDDLGLKVDDIVTFDDVHNMLLAFQSQEGAQYPFMLMSTLDPHSYWGAYETIINYNSTVAPPYVKDGKVQFACSGQPDLEYMQTINSWFNEGLISPNWTSCTGNQDFLPDLVNGVVGMTSMVASEQFGYVDHSIDPDAYWIAIHKPVRYEGQVFHLGSTASWVQYGSWAISAKCENIPLLCTYADYFYSDEGAIVCNWGVEDYTFYWDENGNRMLTDFIVNHPSGSGWALLQFTLNNINEAGILISARNMAKPGGEKDQAFTDIWDDPKFYKYDGSMAWPSAIQFDSEDTERLSAIGADIQTFIAENYLQFVDNSRPLSSWDDYVAQLTAMDGWYEALDIYQRAYDEFQKRFA